MPPRLRVFAGPNGSGKSTLFESFSEKYHTGYFLNADLIEKELQTKGFIDLNDYDLNLTQKDLEDFLQTNDSISLLEKSRDKKNQIHISIKENIIVNVEKDANSYIGALISAFLRSSLMAKKADFCFETVMSHSSKIDEIKTAKTKGYKTYLYFICTDDPEVNISRVENRVEKGGHDVPSERIKSRYYNTLTNLMSAIENSDKCYLFDNSEAKFRLIAKIEDELLLETEPEFLPYWFIEYVLKYYA